MKKVSLLTLCLLISLSLFAQESKRKFAVGGSASFESSKTSYEMQENQEYTNSGFLLSPIAGYYINENFMVGVGFTYYHYKYDQNYGNNSNIVMKENVIEMKPFIRYYTPIIGKLYFYGHLSANYGFGTEEEERLNDNIKSTDKSIISIYGASIVPGISFDLTECISLEASLGNIEYQHSEYKPDNSDEGVLRKNNNFNVDFDLESFGIGLLINF